MPKKKTTTKEELVQEFRITSIRDAASRVVASTGLAGATMDAIAAEAGIAKGTIYLYFENREDLINKTADHALEQLLEEVEELLAQPGDLETQVAVLIEGMLTFFENHRHFFRLYRAVSDRKQGHKDERPPSYQRYFSVLKDWLTRATAERREQGADLPDPEWLTLVITEAIHAVLVRRFDEADPGPAQREITWLTRLLTQGLGGF